MSSPHSSFQPHIQLAHHYWLECLRPGDSAIDATCGNGHDTLVLCKLLLSSNAGHVYALDIQKQALATTLSRLQGHFTENQLQNVHLIKECHSHLDRISLKNSASIRLIVYNLGYLPGGDKSQTTLVHTTLQSLQSACERVMSGGLISITCYPGHPEGLIEEHAITVWAASLSRQKWNCCHHRWINRDKAPSLLLLQKM